MANCLLLPVCSIVIVAYLVEVLMSDAIVEESGG
jgi:hypothetical protein